MEDAQTKLITSEQRRIHLNQELQQLMSRSNKSERLKEIQLKSQMENLKLQRQQSLQRNEMIRRQMQEFELNLAVVSAKTQSLRTMKNEYEDYIEKLYPRWKEEVLARAAQQREKDLRLAGMRRDIGLIDELAVPDLSQPIQDAASHAKASKYKLQTSTNLSDQPSMLLSNKIQPITSYLTLPSAPSFPFNSPKSSDESLHPADCSSIGSDDISSLFRTNSTCTSLSPNTTPLQPLRPLQPSELCQFLQTLGSVQYNGQSQLPPSMENGDNPSNQGHQNGYSQDDHLAYLAVSTQHTTPSHTAPQRTTEQHTAPQYSIPSFSAPNRSSTPEHHRGSTVRGGGMSASMQSINSEKSVTFDESSFKPHRPSVDIPVRSQSNTSDFTFTREKSSAQPRRHTPSPSELIRMSMASTNSSKEGSHASLSDIFTPGLSPPPPITSQPVTHLPPTGHTQSQSVAVTVPSHSAPAPIVLSADIHASQLPVEGVNQSPAAHSQRVTSEPNRLSSPRVIIPSPEDMVEDVESITDSVVDKQDIDGVSSSQHRDQTDVVAQSRTNGSDGAPGTHPSSAPDVNQSMSSLDTTEEQPAVDLTTTAEFKNLLAGTMTSRQKDYNSDDSEDSMAAMEDAYKQLALNKTNTMPVGHDMLPLSTNNEPSPDEELSDDDDDSLSAPMGYTPSFASTAKPINTASMKPPSQASTKIATAATTLPTASSTGGSKNSSGGRKPAHLRTDSDVESGSDTPHVISSGANQKSADNETGNSDLDDDFEFYG